MSAMCQKQTFRAAAKALLFDHLVGGRKQRWWDAEIECLRCLQIKDRLEASRLLHGEIFGLFAFQHPANIHSGLTIAVGEVRPIADQPPAAGYSRWLYIAGNR